jgi:hypothetical protein
LKARYWLALLLHRKGDSRGAAQQMWAIHQRDKGFADPAHLSTALEAQLAEVGAMATPPSVRTPGVEAGGGTPVVADSDEMSEAGTGGGGGSDADAPGGVCPHVLAHVCAPSCACLLEWTHFCVPACVPVCCMVCPFLGAPTRALSLPICYAVCGGPCA